MLGEEPAKQIPFPTFRLFSHQENGIRDEGSAFSGPFWIIGFYQTQSRFVVPVAIFVPCRPSQPDTANIKKAVLVIFITAFSIAGAFACINGNTRELKDGTVTTMEPKGGIIPYGNHFFENNYPDKLKPFGDSRFALGPEPA